MRSTLGALVLAVSVLGAIGPASAFAWHLNGSFGRGGVAGLPVRENGFGGYGAPHGRVGASALMAPGPSGSVFVAGYARSRPGVLLLSRISARGKLVRSFGARGVASIPAIYDTGHFATSRIFALTGGRLLVIGLSRGEGLVAVRLLGNGRVDHSFGHGGVAKYALTGVKRPLVVVAAGAESGGDILVLYQRAVLTGPGEPGVQDEVGEGPLKMMRLLPSGALDSSFGSGGIANAASPPLLTGYPGVGGEGYACKAAVGPDGSAALAFEQVSEVDEHTSNLIGESPALQKLDPSGSDAPGFGNSGTALLPFSPGSLDCGGLFILPNSDIELALGQSPVSLSRFTPSGSLDRSFAGTGHTSVPSQATALNMNPAGETFTVRDSQRSLIVSGVLANGRPDSALGGRHGLKVGSGLPAGETNGNAVVLELLATNAGLAIRVGPDLVALTR